jgi:hypothetical protein
MAAIARNSTYGRNLRTKLLLKAEDLREAPALLFVVHPAFHAPPICLPGD